MTIGPRSFLVCGRTLLFPLSQGHNSALKISVIVVEVMGAVVTQSELSRYADVPTSTTRGWTQGRYTITVEVQPIDGVNANISVNAKIEGRSDGATGAEWQTLPSLGMVEDEFLAALVEAITGTTPPGRAPTAAP